MMRRVAVIYTTLTFILTINSFAGITPSKCQANQSEAPTYYSSISNDSEYVKSFEEAKKIIAEELLNNAKNLQTYHILGVSRSFSKKLPKKRKSLIKKSLWNQLLYKLKMTPKIFGVEKGPTSLKKFENGNELKLINAITPNEVIKKYKITEWTRKCEIRQIIASLLFKAEHLKSCNAPHFSMVALRSKC